MLSNNIVIPFPSPFERITSIPNKTKTNWCPLALFTSNTSETTIFIFELYIFLFSRMQSHNSRRHFPSSCNLMMKRNQSNVNYFSACGNLQMDAVVVGAYFHLFYPLRLGAKRSEYIWLRFLMTIPMWLEIRRIRLQHARGRKRTNCFTLLFSLRTAAPAALRRGL